MSHFNFLTRGRCEVDLGVTPNCTLMPPLSLPFRPNSSVLVFNTIGQAVRGQANFEGNPDIAGIGVLLAFFGTTGLAVSVAWFNAVVQFIFRVVLPKFPSVQREIMSKALSKKLAKFSDLAKDFVLQCSDQLTVTGIIYVVILRTRQACELSAYHYDVVVDLLHVTCITVMLAVVSTTEFWEKNWLGILRVAGGAVLFVLTSFVLILRKVSGMDISPAGTNAELLVLPAVCFADAAERNPLSSNLGADDVLFGIVVVLWAYWLLMDAVASAIGRFGLSNTKPRPRAVTTTFRGGGSEAALLVASCFVVPFGFGVAALIFHAVHVVRLRRWVERSGWLSREDGINPEADLFAIGQALPAALFILVLIPGLSFIFRFFDLIWTFYRTPPESSLALSDGGRSRPGSDISLAPLTRCHGREP